MAGPFRAAAAIASLVLLLPCAAGAQSPAPTVASGSDGRTQYPSLLQNSYVGFDAGYIGYPFTPTALEPGFHVDTIVTPHTAARVALFGHDIARDLAIEATYTRPVSYVRYIGINGDDLGHHVWTQFAALTLKARLPVGGRVSLYGEAGLGLTSRHGFSIGGTPVVRDAHYASAVAGAGVEYRLTASWDVTGGVTFSPGDASVEEPRALLASAGVRYTMRALSDERVAANAASGAFFPRRLALAAYSTAYGYGVNTFFSKTVPIFWFGNADVDRGLAGHYEQNVFHTARLFALDVGASASVWRSRGEHQAFSTLSIYPVFRFFVLRLRRADVYVDYSLAGPTYISRVAIDGIDTGRHFTFQDFMGAGAFVGRARRIVVGIAIEHYSNGNIFTENGGVQVPITLTVGYAF